MMTDDRKGEDGMVSVDGDGVLMISDVGVEGKTPIL